MLAALRVCRFIKKKSKKHGRSRRRRQDNDNPCAPTSPAAPAGAPRPGTANAPPSPQSVVEAVQRRFVCRRRRSCHLLLSYLLHVDRQFGLCARVRVRVRVLLRRTGGPHSLADRWNNDNSRRPLVPARSPAVSVCHCRRYYRRIIFGYYRRGQ